VEIIFLSPASIQATRQPERRTVASAQVRDHHGTGDPVRHVEIRPTFEAWQATARSLLGAGVPPNEVTWREDTDAKPAAAGRSVARVPRQFIELARQVAGHGSPDRWALLYNVLWRLLHEGRDLLEHGADPDVKRLKAMAAEARRGAWQQQHAEMREVEAAGPGAAAFVPANASLPALREAATHCTGCDLYRHATQMVFGRGPARAQIVLVGEQPGDQEDLKGAPFVGPAGEVLDRALREVGLDREQLYVTNAVKHFKFELRGRRRIHQTPRLSEIAACRPWLEAELTVIRPEVVVAMGATAARALFGTDFRLMKERGHLMSSRWAAKSLATIHPSAVLRGPDQGAQDELYHLLVDDLRLAAEASG
jgi:DNA polymerase